MNKSVRKRGLGRGLEALLDKETLNENKPSSTQKVALEKLVPNPHQPRKTFDEAAIEMLADSIRRHGIIQPLAVRSIDGGNFEIIAGERRLRAAKLAKLPEVPVVVHEISNADSAIFALIENLQREDLNIIEKAKGIQSLIENFDLTHEACGQVLGQSRSAVSNTLRLLELSDEVQVAAVEKSIDMGHARALLGVEKAEQHELLQQVMLKGLSVRETENLVRDMLLSKTVAVVPPKPQMRKRNEIRQLEDKLSSYLKTKVNISQKNTGSGKITMAFGDEEMLKELMKRLGLGDWSGK